MLVTIVATFFLPNRDVESQSRLPIFYGFFMDKYAILREGGGGGDPVLSNAH